MSVAGAPVDKMPAEGWVKIAKEGWPVLLGLLAICLPTFYDLAHGLWSSEEQAQGPIILFVVVYLFWSKRNLLKHPACTGGTALGVPILVLGLAAYVVGRTQGILIAEVGSLLLILAGVLVLAYGNGALRTFWFPLFFMLFMLPLPATLVETVTMPMKFAVSYTVANVLYWVGYPIARSGVTLQIGQYMLLVADACAGLHTLFTLEALGLLYLNIVKHNSLFRNATLAVLVVPISFFSNVLRVIALTLITYYFGDAAGQGFLHGFAGMLLFMSALMLIIGIDTLLQAIVQHRSSSSDTSPQAVQ